MFRDLLSKNVFRNGRSEGFSGPNHILVADINGALVEVRLGVLIPCEAKCVLRGHAQLDGGARRQETVLIHSK